MNRSMHYKLGVALLLAGASSLCSCSKDHPDEDDCLREDYTTDVRVSLSVDKAMFDYATVDSMVEANDAETRSEESPMLKYYICAYRLRDGYRVGITATEESFDSNFTLSLPLGKYEVYAWADYTWADEEKDHYFHIDDFSDMMLRDKFGYSGTDPYKVAYCGNADLTVSYRTPELKVNLSAAVGKYIIEATDTPDYEVGKVVVGYPQGVPCSLNLLSDRVIYRWNGVSFESTATDCIAYDNILADTQPSELAVRLEIYDRKGRLRAKRNCVKFPIVRGGVTHVKGNFYSVNEDNHGQSGEGGIDSGFDDTILIGIEK